MIGFQLQTQGNIETRFCASHVRPKERGTVAQERRANMLVERDKDDVG